MILYMYSYYMKLYQSRHIEKHFVVKNLFCKYSIYRMNVKKFRRECGLLEWMKFTLFSPLLYIFFKICRTLRQSFVFLFVRREYPHFIDIVYFYLAKSSLYYIR